MSLDPSPPTFSTAILDSDCSAHYLTPFAPTSGPVTPGPNIHITVPNDEALHSNQVTSLPIAPSPPPSYATLTHIVPGLMPRLMPHSLISIGQLCDAGYTATLTAHTATVSHGPDTIVTGHHDPITCLWHVPLDIPKSQSPAQQHFCQSINPGTNIVDRIAYYHACYFSPALSTWCAAIDAGCFTTWPELTSSLVCKYPLPSIAMVYGNLDQT